MTQLSDLILIKRNLLSKEKCDVIINHFENNSAYSCKESSYEANTHEYKQSTFKTIGLHVSSEAFKIAHETTQVMIDEYAEYLRKFESFHVGYKSKLKFSHQHRVLKYEVGDSIHPHIDHDLFVYGSCTINLNEGYTGGEFNFWNGKHIVELGVGDAIIFPADFFWVHEVNPIKSGVRYSTNTFLTSVPMETILQINGFMNMIDADNLNSPFRYN